jgi:hypothetical protein
MNSSITRIADLPEMHDHFIGSSNGPGMGENGLPNTYTPINTHPNPYVTNSNPNVVPVSQIPPPLSQNGYNANGNGNGNGNSNSNSNPHLSVPMPNHLTPEQQSSLQNIPQQRLPSRDIKINSYAYSQDEEIQPNYIPRKKNVRFNEDREEYEEYEDDYVNRHESLNKKKMEKHQQEQHRTKLIDFVLTEIQIPIFISILYFCFQMNFINTLLVKYLKFLPLYNTDGNLNFNGVLLKSVLFGAAFYSICKFTNYISDI